MLLASARLGFGKMAPIGLGQVMLQPGDRAVVPITWDKTPDAEFSECSAHPEAPPGVAVLQGICHSCEEMNIVVVNEGELAVTISEHDLLAVGQAEDDVPTWEECAVLHGKREQFYKMIDGSGDNKDSVGEVASPKEGSPVESL